MRDSLISPWIAATTTGFAAGGAVWALLSLLTGYLRANNDSLDWFVSLVSMGVAGIVTGVCQGLYLHRLTGKVPLSGWTIATTAGLVSGLAAVGAVGSLVLGLDFTLNFSVSGAYLSLSPYPLVAYGTEHPLLSTMVFIGTSFFLLYFGSMFAFLLASLGGIIPGVLQWFLLRHRFRNAFLWAVFSALAVALSGTVAYVVSWCAGSFVGGATVVRDNPSLATLIGLITWCATGFTIGAATGPVVPWLQSQPLEEGTLF
jgi:hypothetical protein